jgi:hypothetical protein
MLVSLHQNAARKQNIDVDPSLNVQNRNLLLILDGYEIDDIRGRTSPERV